MNHLKPKELDAILERDRQKYLDFLTELIRCDTSNEAHGVYGKEGSGQALIQKTLAELGAEIDVFEPDYSELCHYKEVTLGHEYSGRPNVVGTFRGSGAGRSLILNGHIDTMPFDPCDAWTSHPLDACIRNGKMCQGKWSLR